MTYPYVVALTLHYATSIWRVYDTTFLDKYLLDHPREQIRRIGRRRQRQDSNCSKRSLIRLDKSNLLSDIWQWSIELIIRTYLILAAVLGSMTISLYFDIVWFTLGLISILCGRKIPQENMIGDENKMNFGQIVSILMLASILLTFKEVYTGMNT